LEGTKEAGSLVIKVRTSAVRANEPTKGQPLTPALQARSAHAQQAQEKEKARWGFPSPLDRSARVAHVVIPIGLSPTSKNKLAVGYAMYIHYQCCGHH